MSERRKNLIAYSILAIVPTLLFLDVLIGWNVLYLRDITLYYHPAKLILRDIVLGGEFPYWNPWFSAGQPMAANPEHEVFYPLTWLILLPNYNFGFHLLAVIHVHIAAFAMYALLRAMKLARPSAVFGGLSFALGGVMMSMLNLWPCMFSFAWLPLTALYTRRFLLTRSPRALAAAAFFLGLQLLVGEPVTAFLSGIILGMYAIARGWREGGPLRALRFVGAVGLISILALLISAAQTLPAVDHLGDSVRSRGLDWDTVRGWSMPLVRTGELFFPHLLGYGIPDGGGPFWGAHLYEGRSTPFVFSIYGGIAVAVLAVAGVIARVRGAALFLAISAVSLLLAAGENTPLLRFLFDIGLARSWRYPEKFTMMVGFGSAVFASMVFDRLLAGDERLRRIAIRVAAGLAGIALIATLLSHTPYDSVLFAALYQTPGPPSEWLLTTSARVWATETARYLLFVLLLLTLTRARRGLWLAGLATLMVLDLGPLLFEISPRQERSFYDPPALAESFDDDLDSTRLMPYTQWEGAKKSAPYVTAHEYLFWWLRNGLVPMIPGDIRVRTVFELDFDLTALLPTVDFTRSMVDLVSRGSSDWLNVALSMSNGKYVLFHEKPEIAYEKSRADLRQLQPTRLVKGTAYPRYYFTSELVQIENREQFVDLLTKNRYPRDVAFVDGETFEPAAGSVGAVRETANTASLDVEADGQAFLVMSVTPHKYWRVWIDGEEAEPVVTNIGYQGLVVPPGRHTITMRYRNPLIAAGAAISLATLLALGLIARRSRPATMRPL